MLYSHRDDILLKGSIVRPTPCTKKYKRREQCPHHRDQQSVSRRQLRCCFGKQPAMLHKNSLQQAKYEPYTDTGKATHKTEHSSPRYDCQSSYQGALAYAR